MNTVFSSAFVHQVDSLIEQNQIRDALSILLDNQHISDGYAFYRIGKIYEDSHGGPTVIRKAQYFYQRALDLGSGDAAFRLGLLYEKGNGIERDINTAGKYYQKGVNLEHTDCCVHLGKLLIDKDPERAKNLFLKASSSHSLEGKYQLGLLYLKLNQPEEAEKTFLSIAHQHPQSAYQYASLFWMKSDILGYKADEAFDILVSAAEKNVIEAQVLIGDLCSTKGHIKYNLETAYKYFKKAAENNNESGRNGIERLFQNDDFVPLSELAKAQVVDVKYVYEKKNYQSSDILSNKSKKKTSSSEDFDFRSKPISRNVASAKKIDKQELPAKKTQDDDDPFLGDDFYKNELFSFVDQDKKSSLDLETGEAHLSQKTVDAQQLPKDSSDDSHSVKIQEEAEVKKAEKHDEVNPSSRLPFKRESSNSNFEQKNANSQAAVPQGQKLYTVASNPSFSTKPNFVQQNPFSLQPLVPTKKANARETMFVATPPEIKQNNPFQICPRSDRKGHRVRNAQKSSEFRKPLNPKRNDPS